VLNTCWKVATEDAEIELILMIHIISILRLLPMAFFEVGMVEALYDAKKTLEITVSAKTVL
jgi:hypothetical protein